MHDRFKLGEILVQAGLIDEMQLQAALGEQARWGRRLGVTLIKMGMVEEGHLIRALAKQLDLPVASLAGKKIPEDVLALVPCRVATEHCVVPLFTNREGPGGKLFLGMEDPSNLAVLDDLRFRTGMEIHPVMVGPTELGEAIDRFYLGGASNPTPSADPFRSTDTLGEGSLYSVDDDPEPRVELRPSSPSQEPRAADSESGEKPIELSEAMPTLPEGLLENVARALEETEQTRSVTRAIAGLLIEKGVLTLEEVQERIAERTTTDAAS
jgi:hypothetical protein